MKKKLDKEKKSKNTYMPSTELKNFTISKLKDKNQNPYYLVKDNEKQEVYFCFQKSLKEGWEELEQNHQTLKEVEIEYILNEKGSRRVVSLWGG